MTVGHSALVEAFLMHKAAEKKPQFEVIVVEGSPSNEVCSVHISLFLSDK
jgi:translation initiation factor 2B subunit (eIF-2B alpha/beta/delta family)